MQYKLINLKVMGDERGKLVALESSRNIPFEIKRVYYIFDTLPEQVRGKHAHKNLEQLIVAIDGACEFVLDDGKERKSIWLNRPDVGLYIMVIASEYYEEKEYIRDYDEFLKEVNNG